LQQQGRRRAQVAFFCAYFLGSVYKEVCDNDGR